LNRFKAPRKNLGALLFFPQVEQVQSSEEKPRGFAVLSATLRLLSKNLFAIDDIDTVGKTVE